MKLPVLIPKSFRIIAHRGASGYAPENTRAAFNLAEKMQCLEFELDVQMSLDGKLVICHDLTLERYGHGKLVVESLHSEDLLKLDMGSWFSPHFFRSEKMITLPSLLDDYRRKAFFHIEIKGKSKGLPQQICKAIRDFNIHENCIVTSFEADMLKAVGEIEPALPTGWLVKAISPETLEIAESLKLYQICPKAENVTNESVFSARGKIEQVRAWGISGNREEVLNLITQVVQAGCHGMTINWPDWVTRVI